MRSATQQRGGRRHAELSVHPVQEKRIGQAPGSRGTMRSSVRPPDCPTRRRHPGHTTARPPAHWLPRRIFAAVADGKCLKGSDPWSSPFRHCGGDRSQDPSHNPIRGGSSARLIRRISFRQGCAALHSFASFVYMHSRHSGLAFQSSSACDRHRARRCLLRLVPMSSSRGRPSFFPSPFRPRLLLAPRSLCSHAGALP